KPTETTSTLHAALPISIGDDDAPSTEMAPYRPRNPYAASKAAADHFVEAFHATHGLSTLVTRGSNTYGPGQHPEKLIALAIDRIDRKSTRLNSSHVKIS